MPVPVGAQREASAPRVVLSAVHCSESAACMNEAQIGRAVSTSVPHGAYLEPPQPPLLYVCAAGAAPAVGCAQHMHPMKSVAAFAHLDRQADGEIVTTVRLRRGRVRFRLQWWAPALPSASSCRCHCLCAAARRLSAACRICCAIDNCIGGQPLSRSCSFFVST